MNLLWLVPFAIAQSDPDPVLPASDGGELSAEELATVEEEEIVPDHGLGTPHLEVIVSDQAVQQAKKAVEQDLEAMGYERKRRRGSFTIYDHPTNWKPRVLVHDDGFIVIRRQPPKIQRPDIPGAWWDKHSAANWLPCLTVPTLCVRVGGMVIAPRKLAHQKEAVVEATEDDMRAFVDALTMEALYNRIYEDLPTELDSLWLDGRDPNDGRTLSSFEERRAAILALWTSRTDNEYGDAVREAIELYMVYVVQVSDHPFTDEEIARVNATRTCQRELVLPELNW